ncbi:hypothetical protein Dsin_018025 [Dipteronia sinensis]|uniref:Uncharacterized protein n=1 Tax=Dipteronia sinensis TaxID=43782 RepID=A0AAE0E735_9ROSI|nr:hypothetical protein Dsin_018025 [Dipteronia sinensis]
MVVDWFRNHNPSNKSSDDDMMNRDDKFMDKFKDKSKDKLMEKVNVPAKRKVERYNVYGLQLFR